MTTQGRTILIVDTDPGIVAMLDLVLSELGFVPRCAHSAREALDACAAQAPDLALVDIDVPGWVDLLTGLRRMNPLIRCCLVGAAGMTAHTTEELRLLGAACFFSKPFTLQQLKAALE